MSLERLEPFVGEWTLEAVFEGAETGGTGGRTSFEWALGGRFLIQRADVDHPDAPDLFAVIAPDADGDGFTQHYFDSRGVVRIYAMTLEGRTWTLLREQADFSPLSFRQRYVGEFGEDGRTIEGRWEMGSDDGGWKLDFGLNYTRA
jgi:hypothetical protein